MERRHPVLPVVRDDGAEKRRGDRGVLGVVRDEHEVDERLGLLPVVGPLVVCGVDRVHVSRHAVHDLTLEAELVGGVEEVAWVQNGYCGHCSPFRVEGRERVTAVPDQSCERLDYNNISILKSQCGAGEGTLTPGLFLGKEAL